MKCGILLLGFILAAALTSCGLKAFDEEGGAAAPEDTTVSEASSLFAGNGEGNVFVFETNDTRYLGTRGYTLWTTPETNASQSFEPISVRISKESGRTEAGFGIVMCSQEIGGKPFMLTVLINAKGLYTVGKVVDGVFSHINGGWKDSSYINKGHGTYNNVSVSYDGESRNFLLRINGYDITDFTVPEEISFRGSRSGYAVVIAHNEDFPRTSVKVIFEK